MRPMNDAAARVVLVLAADGCRLPAADRERPQKVEIRLDADGETVPPGARQMEQKALMGPARPGPLA
jgi:hypothetical protein